MNIFKLIANISSYTLAMAATNRSLLTYLTITLLVAQILSPADAGIKDLVHDTYHKVHSNVRKILGCTSHETDDEHLNAISKDESVNTIDEITESETTNDKINKGNVAIISTPPTTTTEITTTYILLDVRAQEEERSIVNVDCRTGYRRDHVGICREVV